MDNTDNTGTEHPPTNTDGTPDYDLITDHAFDPLGCVCFPRDACECSVEQRAMCTWCDQPESAHAAPTPVTDDAVRRPMAFIFADSYRNAIVTWNALGIVDARIFTIVRDMEGSHNRETLQPTDRVIYVNAHNWDPYFRAHVHRYIDTARKRVYIPQHYNITPQE